ncbi:MAG: YciI family protein [Pseudomonadota bacterium]|nr:YciI family protein [Pseudomonadota bacterium]
MLIAIMAQDAENSLEARLSVREAHLARLTELQNQGRLVLAGPHPINEAGDTSEGFSGSLIVAEFDSLDDAQEWAQNDPYIDAGVYTEVLIKPFLQVFPKA